MEVGVDLHVAVDADFRVGHLLNQQGKLFDVLGVCRSRSMQEGPFLQCQSGKENVIAGEVPQRKLHAHETPIGRPWLIADHGTGSRASTQLDLDDAERLENSEYLAE